MTKPNLKTKAVELRKAGYSYNLIRQQISVSKSTLSLWLKDTPFKPNEIVVNRIRGAILRVHEWQNSNKKESIKAAKQYARSELGALSPRDLFLLGLGVYIGEGSKTRGNTRIINSDPRVISLAIRWFEETFGLKKKNFSITIHLYPDNNLIDAVNFWSQVTGIPKNQFGKVQIDMREKKLKKRGMLKYGTAHLYVHSRGNKKFGVQLFRNIVALIDAAFKQID